MIKKELFVGLLIVRIVLTHIYIFETKDNLSVESYDCISIKNLIYCRRPNELIDLERDKSNEVQCYNNGQIHWFDELQLKNIKVEKIFHQWKSSIEKVEEYSYYLKSSNKSNDYLCECIDKNSFGKYCEYKLSIGTNLDETFDLLVEMKLKFPWDVQKSSDIICYRTLECNSGLLCLDWRDICNGVQECMSGFDEDNCDNLQLNQCEQDEYRCLNGMCIPDEYFLDGQFDCLDWTDEIPYYDDEQCSINGVNFQCEDRMCRLNQWSCGDGQCISDRLAFQKANKVKSECVNRRDQYFLCETHYSQPMWTMSNGKCHLKGYQDNSISNQTIEQQCYYLLKCGLSAQAERSCPCGRNISCKQSIETICRQESILYPQGPILGPYVFYFYNRTRTRGKFAPDFIQYNGTFKCGKSFINLNSIEPFSYNISLQSILSNKCQLKQENRIINHHNHHRFRCSSDELFSLSINLLGNSENDCKNKFDELWFGENKKLSDMNCNNRFRDECYLIREYLKSSWISSNIQLSINQVHVSFRHYCNTFWDFHSKKDENIQLCKKWWICSQDQWQCRNGQCIENNWLLDGEWDCSDASDEEAFSNRTQFESLPFNNICDLTKEFACLTIDSLNPLKNLTNIRPCISLDKIGDGHIDCHGGIDERNTMELCDQSSMLGYNYWCQSSKSCIPYWLICAMTCSNLDDDQFQCTQRQNTSTCGNIEDFACLNGTCIINGRCNRIRDCFFGEDEYMCDYQGTAKTMSLPYRKQKQLIIQNKHQIIQLEHLNNNSFNRNQSKDNIFLSTSFSSSLNLSNSRINDLFVCNRGIPVYSLNNSIVCLCSVHYYGDRCQYHADRLSVLFHLNVSSSSLFIINQNESSMMFKLVISFEYENESLSIEQIYSEPSLNEILFPKTLVYFPYPRSFKSRQNLTNRYSILIEMYQLIENQMVKRICVWQYKINFDNLPVYRLAKVLRLTRSKLICLNNKFCHENEQCYPIENIQSKFICLCKSGYHGKNCSIEDEKCREGYCSSLSFCKSKSNGNLPSCICPLNRFGDRCHLEHDQCLLNRCENGGRCYPRLNPLKFVCLCQDAFYGDRCQLRKSKIELNFNENIFPLTSVIQYLRIESISLDLILIDQSIFKDFLGSFQYSFGQDIVPEIVLIKFYESSLHVSPRIHLVSLNLNKTFVNKTIQINETTQCLDIRLSMSNLSPIEYHRLCQINKSLECFYDSWYLCLCSFDHSHVECFNYNHQFDQCSYCLANGRCLKGNPHKFDDFICLCPECHSGFQCQFSSNSFAFTLDQLFYIDLVSSKQDFVMFMLIFVSLLMFLIGFPSNIFSLLTFRRRKCLLNSVGQYLYYLSIINQLNLTFLSIRLIHLSKIIIDVESHLKLNNILCKLLSYCLSCSIRLSDWLSCLVALERVYSTVFLKRGWLQKPHIIRRIFTLICLLILLSSVYELIFIRAFTESNTNSNALCVIDFTGYYRSFWRIVHQTVSITHSILPIFINIFCTITIICIIIKNKMKINKFN